MKVFLVLLVIAIVVSLGVRKALRNHRVNTVLTSDVGQRYLANLEATGSATQTGNISDLARLVAEREDIIRDAKNNSVDLELIDALIADAMRHGRIISPNHPRAMPASACSDNQTIAGELYRCGDSGASSLAGVIGEIVQRSGASPNPERMVQGPIVQAHALVWFAISSHLPVADGRPLMQAHLEVLQSHLAEDDDSISGNELQAAIGRQWTTYVERPEVAGGQLYALAALILEYYVPQDRLSIDDANSVAEIIVAIVKNASRVLMAEYAS